MITLGINAAFHDSAAAIVVDGVVVAAAEEERFTRIKHAKRPVPFSAWELPFHAIDFCLARAGVTLAQCDRVGYSFRPEVFAPDPSVLSARSIELPLGTAGQSDTTAWENPWDPLFLAEIMAAPAQLIDGVPHHLQSRMTMGPDDRRPDWHFVDHHLCHQASAFLAAPFERCAVMTLDGRGERASTTYGRYRQDGYRRLGEVQVPDSLGLLCERIATHLGFLHSSDEYKVMALAAHGEARGAAALRDAIKVGTGGQFRIAPLDLEHLFGPARRRGEPLRQHHFDIAAALQAALERASLELGAWLRRASGERDLAMAGGVALNCVMNSALRDSGLFDNVWVQPAAGDAGTALGAALWLDARARLPSSATQALEPDRTTPVPDSSDIPLAPRAWRMHDACLGPEYTDKEIEQQLAWAKLDYRRMTDIARETAALLADNLIIGWFQGRMEYGPRALGSRSIIASPIDPHMQARLNELKDREDFRPVAPAIPLDDLGRWFLPAAANGGRSPFMLFVYDVMVTRADQIPAVCHADLTARVQTVDADIQPRFHALLKAFGKETGVPILVNTSFNVRGQPIVCTPRDAVEAFFSTPLDALVIGSFLVRKPAHAPPAA